MEETVSMSVWRWWRCKTSQTEPVTLKPFFFHSSKHLLISSSFREHTWMLAPNSANSSTIACLIKNKQEKVKNWTKGNYAWSMLPTQSLGCLLSQELSCHQVTIFCPLCCSTLVPPFLFLIQHFHKMENRCVEKQKEKLKDTLYICMFKFCSTLWLSVILSLSPYTINQPQLPVRMSINFNKF